MDSDPMSLPLTTDSILSRQELNVLTVEIKSIVWLLKIHSQISRTKIAESVGTAFSIDKDGLIMSSAHLFISHSNKSSECTISARKIDETFFHEVEAVEIKSKWDIALLRVKSVSDWKCGRFAVDRSLCVGQKLVHIGNPGNFTGSFFVGSVAFPCVDKVHVPLDNQVCSKYECTAMHITPQYRIMGHVWNNEVGKEQIDNRFWRHIHPEIPIIQINGFGCGEGCSGGPVFNLEGEIVGMLAMGCGGFDIAIHSSLFRQVLDKDSSGDAGYSKQGGNQAGCSKRH